MLLMGLRLSEGVPLDRLMQLGGVRPAPAAIAELVKLGLLAVSPVAAAVNGSSKHPDDIIACAGPGLPPEGMAFNPSRRIRATAEGRLVLNAVVAKLAGAFEPASRMDNTASAS